MELETISAGRLALSFLPVAAVIAVMASWNVGVGRAFHAIGRMLLQLTLVGYVLVYIFQTESVLVVSGVLSVMVVAASWIALNTVDVPRRSFFLKSLVSIALGGGATLFLIVWGVLRLDPWYTPNSIIPLAGMIFAASMTNISLAFERLHAEMRDGVEFPAARDIAFRTSMIPVINSFFAVGLISLPGMMTGQILSGVSPLIAVRYQIMVMCMVFGAAGLSTACFLALIRRGKSLQAIG